MDIETIKRECAASFGITTKEMVYGGRASKFVTPRHVAIYAARKITGKSLPDIADEFNMECHQSVMNAMRKIDEMMEVAKVVNNLMAQNRPCE